MENEFFMPLARRFFDKNEFGCAIGEFIDTIRIPYPEYLPKAMKIGADLLPSGLSPEWYQSPSFNFYYTIDQTPVQRCVTIPVLIIPGHESVSIVMGPADLPAGLRRHTWLPAELFIDDDGMEIEVRRSLTCNIVAYRSAGKLGSDWEFMTNIDLLKLGFIQAPLKAQGR